MNARPQTLTIALTSLVVLFLLPPPSAAAGRLCDTAFEDCRSPLINLIRQETVAIDVAFWFMEDTRYATELIRRFQAGVPVRVVVDARAVTQYKYTQAARPLQMLKDAGIPMRTKSKGGILHFKTMIFAGQSTVQFSAANYSPEAFVPIQPYTNYIDEIIYFTGEASIVNSFMTRFDDIWTDTASFTAYANQPGPPVRRYATLPIDPALNFVPWESFRSRSLAKYRQETQRVDSIMYRITDRAHSDAMIRAVARGVPVRLITEQQEYRNPGRLWHSWNVDRMYAAGVQVRLRGHAGLLHEKLTILNGLGHAIFGSSNWTSASSSSQHEHNLFTSDPAFLSWVRDHFDRKWTNRTGNVETQPFVPLPPDTPSLVAPADGAPSQGGSVTLTWYAGPWAHKYDVYLGTSPSAMTRVLNDRELGPSENTRDNITWTVSGLAGNTTYYWRVVSRTMANVERASVVRSFSTGAGVPAGRVTSVSFVRNTDGSLAFTANTEGAAVLEYKWWLFNGRLWTVLRNWGSAGSITWNPPAAGTYRVGVWVRNAGSTIDAAQSNAGVDVTVGAGAAGQPTVSGVTSTASSPHAVGSPITFTANATGGVAPLQFKWWLFDGRVWTVVRDWSSGNSIAWVPPRAGTYRMGVWVRSAGRTADAPQSNAGIDITVVAPFTSVRVSRTGPSPLPANSAATFTAAATGGSGVAEFKWWLFNGSAWVVLQNWSRTNAVTWTPARAGSYRVGAWVRNAGSTKDAPETNAGIDVLVGGP